jgi:putative ABC transport system permease protein
MTNDVRYAVRLSVNAPALTSLAVLTLALCIGVNSTLFSAVNTVLLRPLPFQNPSELYVVSSTFQGTRREFTSFTDFSDWRAYSRSFAQMAAVRGNGASITTPTGPEYLTGAAVSEDFFAVFATPPLLGRSFVSADHRRGEGHVVILSDALWRRRFGANQAVIGTSIVLDGESSTIVGVMPKGFAFPDDVEFWTPLTLTASDAARRADLVRVVGRLRAGVAPTQANAELAGIARRLAQRFPSTNAGWGVTLTPLQAKSTEDIRRTLLALWGAVTCVLLIGCANIGMLVLSRSIRRTHEFAVRTALGAGRWRLARQWQSKAFCWV